MTFDALAPMGLDYKACRYGTSKLLFRGPCRDLSRPYLAFLGGTATYGKFIEKPFVDILEDRLGVACANFGCINSGVDSILNDPVLPDAAGKSRATVLQVPGAQNMSNRFYTVHPRRNDRFVSATPMLRAIYPDVDFTNFHFNRHMLNELRELSEERYWIVEQELRQAWIARMTSLLERIAGRVVLVWISDRSSEDLERVTSDPMHVTAEMLGLVTPLATEYVEVSLSPDARRSTLDGKVFRQMEAPAAREMLGPQAHVEIADALYPVLSKLI